MTDVNAPILFPKTSKSTAKALTKVLVVTDNTQSVKQIVKELRHLELDVQLALFDGYKLTSIPKQSPDAVLCYFTDYIEASGNIVKTLRHHFAPRDIPIIGAATRATKANTDHFDSMIFAPMHSSQIANRVRSMIRLGQMEAEITRRIATINEDFGYDVALPNAIRQQPFQILFIGKATPAFMVVINALQKKNVNVIAAFTSFTAFDYLHEERFDAVVMNAIGHDEPAISISEAMRRNSALYHIPTLFLVDPDNFTQYDRAYKSGVNDIIVIDSPQAEISGRILELANYYRIHEQLKSEFNFKNIETCVDETTQLFNGDFFAAHLKRIKAASEISKKAFSTLALRARPDGTGDVNPAFMQLAFSQLGLMLKNLVRMQDIVARIDDDLFAFILPNTLEDEAYAVIERIKNVIDCAAFDSGLKHEHAFTLSVDVTCFNTEDYPDNAAVKAHMLLSLQDDNPHLQALA